MSPLRYKTPWRRHCWFYQLVVLLMIIAVDSTASSSNLLDRFATAFQQQGSPPAAGPVIPDSLPLPPISGDQVDPCYDQENAGRARRCAPDFVNAAFGREIRASSTCGEAGPSRYCVPSGTTSRTSSSSSSCHVCDASEDQLSHSASHLTDLNNPNNVTCWMSEPAPPAANNNVSLTLSLGKKFEVWLPGCCYTVSAFVKQWLHVTCKIKKNFLALSNAGRKKAELKGVCKIEK